MNIISQDNFEYRHKKFDQSKESRTNSSCSSGGDNEEYSHIKQEEVGKIEPATFIAERSRTNSSCSSGGDHEEYSHIKQEEVGKIEPATFIAERSRTNSFCSSRGDNPEYSHIKQEKVYNIEPATFIAKRSRKNSSCSFGRDNKEYLHIKQEEVDKKEPPTFIENTPVVNLSTRKSRNLKRPHSDNKQPDFHLLPEAKRVCRNVFTPTLNLPFAAPLPMAVTAAVATATAPTATVIPPTTAILPKISDETLRNICKYHGNMVRKFPKKERTPKDQERRNKNTIACRMSRRVKKLEHIAIEEQYKQFSQQAFEITEKALRATAYLHELMRLLECNSTSIKEELPTSSTKLTISPASRQEKKPFSIAFLAGSE